MTNPHCESQRQISHYTYIIDYIHMHTNITRRMLIYTYNIYFILSSSAKLFVRLCIFTLWSYVHIFTRMFWPTVEDRVGRLTGRNVHGHISISTHDA